MKPHMSEPFDAQDELKVRPPENQMCGRGKEARMNEKRSTREGLTPGQQILNDLWEEHLRDEFTTQDTKATLETMVPDAYVNHIPVLTGGVGHEQLREFYSRHFIPKMPPDTDITPVSRTIRAERLVADDICRL